MRELLFVFIGGGMGSVLRFMVSMWWRHMQCHPRYASIIFPWPTLVVNLIGSLLISVLYWLMESHWQASPEQRLLLTTGLCGGLTTFSTFSYETATLLSSGHYGLALLYIGISLTMGILLAFVPIWIK
ncbi:MAG: fluoride efflux transporter CrcB [Bacteroidales bacterium]|nr:fluoride efflux transporter CrcB [Bacteroidales bacterium]